MLKLSPYYLFFLRFTAIRTELLFDTEAQSNNFVSNVTDETSDFEIEVTNALVNFANETNVEDIDFESFSIRETHLTSLEYECVGPDCGSNFL